MRARIARALTGAAVTCLVTGMALAAAGPAAADQARPRDSARASLQPWPVTLTIRTVPALAGIRFAFDGVQLVTNRQGVASFTERHNFSGHTLALKQIEVGVSGRRYTFLRWAGQRDPDQAFRPAVHGLPMRADYSVTASFAVACAVTPRLVEQNGTPLPAGEVSRITLLSSLGQNVNLSPSGTTWLPCASSAYRDSLLSSRSVQYSVQSVVVGGTNVVHAGVERFSPGQTPEPRLTGFFYALTITAHDAMLGGALGSYALLTMPDRTVRRVELGARHTATVGDLPLGDYQVQVKAGGATVSAVTVHLSRDETANLTAISRIDIAIVGAALAIGIAGAPLLSRTRRGRLRARTRRIGQAVRPGPRQPRAGEEAGR